MKYIISTLGCKVNQYETQAMETLLKQHGHSPAEEGEQADAVIVNTCAVTAESGRKSRQTIRRLKEANPGAVLAVCGCYSQISRRRSPPWAPRSSSAPQTGKSWWRLWKRPLKKAGAAAA
ncbi:MAG: hypothetical protein V8T45_10105 [Oscillospiraceae bacterium]